MIASTCDSSFNALQSESLINVSPLKAKEARLLDKQAAMVFAEKHKGWVYVIPSYKANYFKKLKDDLTDHHVSTVQEMGWSGKKNGDLLELMLSLGFDALITVDKSLRHQQNFKKFSVPVLVLNVHNLTYTHISELLPKLKMILDSKLEMGPTIISKN